MQGNLFTNFVSIKPLRFVDVMAHYRAIIERCEPRFDTPYSPYPNVDADHDAGCFYSLLQKLLSFRQLKGTTHGGQHSHEQHRRQ